MNIDIITENNHVYSTQWLNRYVFDIDQQLQQSKYFIDRKKYQFKSGKYEKTSYYMMTVMYPPHSAGGKFMTWFLENNTTLEKEHKDFLRLLIKRHKLNKIIDNRMTLGQIKGTYDFEL